MNRVIDPSTGSSYTMSAHDSPVWGLAAGRFSTLMARAGLSGTVPFEGSTPVSGHTEGGGEGVGEGDVGVVGGGPLLAALTLPALCPRKTTAPAAPPARTRTVTTLSTIRPRLVGLMSVSAS